MGRMTFLFAASTAGALCAGGAVHGQCQYEVTVIAQFNPNCNSPTTPHAIGLGDRISGHIVTCGSFADAPVVWTPETGTVILPKPPGAADVIACGTIGTDVVIGRATGLVMDYKPIKWVNGQLAPITYPPQAQEVDIIGARENGLIGGYWRRTGGGTPRPFLLLDDEFVDLHEFVEPPLIHVITTDLNDHGVMSAYAETEKTPADTVACTIGWNGVTPIPRPDNWFMMRGTGITNDGTVVGWGRTTVPGVPGDKGDRAFRWSGGEVEELPVIDAHNEARATDVNDLGIIVGFGRHRSPTGFPSNTCAVIWINGEAFPLEALAEGGGASFGTAGSVNKIDDYGNIITRGVSNGQSVAYLFKPIRSRRGDVSLDGKVDVRDLKIVFDHWGTCWPQPHGPGDANGDHMVDGADLGEVLGDWDMPVPDPPRSGGRSPR